MPEPTTLGELLIQYVVNQMLIDFGSKVHSEYKSIAPKSSIPENFELVLESQSAYLPKNLYGDKPVENKVIYFTHDPWDKMAELILGRKLPKRGMATYFIKYCQAISLIKNLKGQLDEINSWKDNFEAENEEIQSLIQYFLDQYEIEKIDDLPSKLEALGFPKGPVMVIEMKVRLLQERLNSRGEESKDILSNIETMNNLVYMACGIPASFEEFSKKRPLLTMLNKKAVLLELIRALTKTANYDDLMKVRHIAEEHFSNPLNRKRFLLLTSHRRV